MKKKKSDSAGKTAKTADAKAFAHKSIEVAANQLRPAPWNPRPEITSESVADITASLPKVGLIHPLVVMKDPDKPSCKGVDFYVIISGHRRFRACVDARYYPIPCDLVDVDVATAKQMTIIENLQRRDADPLLESELVKSLLDGGMTQAEIAAETGRGERWVARRANLMKLSEGWRERIRKGEKFTTDCLEHIAAYPVEIQEKLKDEGKSWGDQPIAWSDIDHQFNMESRDLRDAKFNTTQCLSCTNNTGCCPDLFDQDGRKNAQLGRCLCEKCWQEKTAAHMADTIAKAEKKGVQIVHTAPWNCGCYNYGERKSKENTTLYVFKENGGRTDYRWGMPPVNKTSGASAEPDDSSAEKKLEEKREKRERNKAIRKLAALCATGNNLADWLDLYFSCDPPEKGVVRYAPFIVQNLFHGMDSYELAGSSTALMDAAAAFCLGKFEIPKHWTRLVAPQIIRELDPSRCEGYRAVPNAQLICAMFPAEVTRAPDGLTDDEVALIKAKSDPLSEMEVEWDDSDAEDDIDDATSGEVD
jgi:ParB/RepB/Spo0J family partition protein